MTVSETATKELKAQVKRLAAELEKEREPKRRSFLQATINLYNKELARREQR